MRKTARLIPVILVLCLLLVFGLYQVPAVNSRISPRIDNLRSQIKYAINPPDEALFIPEGGTDPGSQSEVSPPPTWTPAEVEISAQTSTATLPPGEPTSTPEPTPTETATLPPLPELVILDGVVYVDQHNAWNYCGPANLTMALKYWGWSGDRHDVARVVKPGIQDPNLDFIQQGRWDKNVMPYEMADYVINETEYSAVIRHGGDLEIIKRLITGGFPVLIEKGYYEADYTGKVGWLGHYLFTTGFDENARGIHCPGCLV